MDASVLLWVVIGYFAVLYVISFWTGRKADEKTFFTANRNSPWYLVAFGMIGATLSGVTFISVPGAVGPGKWAYFEFVLGNFVGYVVIAFVLLPLYYRLNLTSIYGYLEQRYGRNAYLAGAICFLVSRIIGASFRLYLVALVLQLAVSNALGIPFWLTVLISIALIYVYTFRGGIKTVVWTDTLQTLFILLGAGLAVYYIGEAMQLDFGGMIGAVSDSSYSETFFWDWSKGNHFLKQFFSGACISIVMVGLDQDMMQKNLTCRNLREAKTNMLSFSSVFVIANIFFLGLGAMMYLFGLDQGIIQETVTEAGKYQLMIKEAGADAFTAIRTDELFPILALQYLGPVAAIFFVLGVIAAAYSSADSALTALTTSFCVDILGFEKRQDEDRKQRIRYGVHMGFALVLFVVIIVFNLINDRDVVTQLFIAAGYTYGPLLGLFAFGMFNKIKANDKWVPYICIIAPILTFLIQRNSKDWFDYEFGFEILILNGFLVFLGLFISSLKRSARS